MGLTELPLIGGVFEGIPVLDTRSKIEKIVDQLFSFKVLIGLGLLVFLLSKGGVLK